MLNAMLWAIVPLLVVAPLAILLEAIVPRVRYPLRDKIPGALYLILLLPAAATAVAWPLRLLWRELGIEPLVNISELPMLARFAIIFVLVDFLRYWEHRFEHKFFWRVHVVHHAPHDVHATSVVAHPFGALPEFFIIAIPVSMIDAGAMPVAAGLLLALQNFLVHASLTVHAGPLRRIYVDNRFHRIHHSIEPRHRDKNFGIVFSVWDQLFGTAHMPAEDEWPDAGVPGVTAPRNPLGYLAWPLKPSRAGSTYSPRQSYPPQKL